MHKCLIGKSLHMMQLTLKAALPYAEVKKLYKGLGLAAQSDRYCSTKPYIQYAMANRDADVSLLGLRFFGHVVTKLTHFA